MIADEERQAAKRAQRADVLTSFLQRYNHYNSAIESLDVTYEEDIPIMAALLRAVGAKVTLDPKMFEKANERGVEPDVQVELPLSAMSQPCPSHVHAPVEVAGGVAGDH
jgi:hypothetical protein